MPEFELLRRAWIYQSFFQMVDDLINPCARPPCATPFAINYVHLTEIDQGREKPKERLIRKGKPSLSFATYTSLHKREEVLIILIKRVSHRLSTCKLSLNRLFAQLTHRHSFYILRSVNKVMNPAQVLGNIEHIQGFIRKLSLHFLNKPHREARSDLGRQHRFRIGTENEIAKAHQHNQLSVRPCGLPWITSDTELPSP